MLPLRGPLALALLVLLSGCFTADATLEPNGSGTIALEYVPAPDATVDSERARFSSRHVTVRELVPRQVGGFLEASFDDVTQLSSAKGFENVTVARERKHGVERLRVTLRNPSPQEIVNPAHPGPRVSISLPGRVLAANGDADISGRRVSWRLPLREWARRPRIMLSVRYAVG
jgi:hypothetical protein